MLVCMCSVKIAISVSIFNRDCLRVISRWQVLSEAMIGQRARCGRMGAQRARKHYCLFCYFDNVILVDSQSIILKPSPPREICENSLTKADLSYYFLNVFFQNKLAIDTLKYYIHGLCFILVVLMFCSLGQQVENEVNIQNNY